MLGNSGVCRLGKFSAVTGNGAAQRERMPVRATWRRLGEIGEQSTGRLILVVNGRNEEARTGPRQRTLEQPQLLVQDAPSAIENIEGDGGPTVARAQEAEERGGTAAADIDATGWGTSTRIGRGGTDDTDGGRALGGVRPDFAGGGR